MKFFSTLVFLNSLTICLFAQTNNSDTTILKLFVINNRLQNQIVYADKSLGWDKLKELVNEKEITWKGEKQSKTIRLTKKERNYILGQIEENKNLVWGDNLFANSKRIPADSMLRYLKNELDVRNDSINKAIARKDYATIDKLNKLRPWAFGFSKPIYFRDNKYCLLFQTALCGRGDCGFENINVLINEDGEWRLFIFTNQRDY